MDNLSILTLSSSSQPIQLNQHPQKQEQQEAYHDKIPTLSQSTDHVSKENKSIKSRFFSWIARIDVKATLANAGGIILGISLIILGIIKNHQASQPINPFFSNSHSIPDLVIEEKEKVQSPDATNEDLSNESAALPVETPTATEIPQQEPSVFEALKDKEVTRLDNQMMKNRASRQTKRKPTGALRENVEKRVTSEPTAPVEKPTEETTASPIVNSRANPNIGNRIAHLQQQGGIKIQLPGIVPNFPKQTKSQEN